MYMAAASLLVHNPIPQQHTCADPGKRGIAALRPPHTRAARSINPGSRWHGSISASRTDHSQHATKQLPSPATCCSNYFPRGCAQATSLAAAARCSAVTAESPGCCSCCTRWATPADACNDTARMLLSKETWLRWHLKHRCKPA